MCGTTRALSSAGTWSGCTSSAYPSAREARCGAHLASSGRQRPHVRSLYRVFRDVDFSRDASLPGEGGGSPGVRGEHRSSSAVMCRSGSVTAGDSRDDLDAGAAWRVWVRLDARRAGAQKFAAHGSSCVARALHKLDVQETARRLSSSIAECKCPLEEHRPERTISGQRPADGPCTRLTHRSPRPDPATVALKANDEPTVSTSLTEDPVVDPENRRPPKLLCQAPGALPLGQPRSLRSLW